MNKILGNLKFAIIVTIFAVVMFSQSSVSRAVAPIAYLGFENSSWQNGDDCCNWLFDSWNNNKFRIPIQGHPDYLHNWISGTMPNEGSKSFGVELKTPPPPTTPDWKDDPKWAKQRIEFEISNNDYYTQRMEDSRYYGFAVYIHHNSPDTIQKGAIFMQAWQRHVTSPGKHPPFSLRLEDDSDYKWSVNVSRDSSTLPEGAEETIFTSTEGLAVGEWHEFIVWFKPSVVGKGAVRVWHNGELKVSQTSQRNFGYKPHSSAPAVYSDFAVRFGAYRRPEPGRTQDLTLMFDQAKFGTSYDSVDP